MNRLPLVFAIGLLLASAGVLGWLGFSSFSISKVVLLLLMALAIAMIWQQFSRQQRQATLVLKALANQDVSFRLRQQPQLQSLLTEVQRQLALSRQQAEARAEYLAALLVQLEVAVLEFDQTNTLLQANPAAERLLGKTLLQLAGQGLTADSPAPLSVLWQKLQSERPLQQGELLWVQQGVQDRLAFSLVQSHILGQPRKLLTLQSIQQQLLQQEVQAYQQLTRVLTHEIANSITPMVSLAQSSLALLPAPEQLMDMETHADLTLANETIAQRGAHLSQFIQSFKQLSSPIQAKLEPIALPELIQRVGQLLKADLAAVQLSFKFPEQSPTLWLDAALTEQVLINLLKNALEATQQSSQQPSGSDPDLTPKVAKIGCHLHFQQRWVLDITDNGPGVADSAVAKLFIPFYTTKRSGSGIGLSLARMLMQAQGGELIYISQTEGACFRVLF